MSRQAGCLSGWIPPASRVPNAMSTPHTPGGFPLARLLGVARSGQRLIQIATLYEFAPKQKYSSPRVRLAASH